MRVFSMVFVLFLIWGCQDNSTNDSTQTTAKAEMNEGLSEPIIEVEEAAVPDRDVTVGQIKEACQLISEEWLKKNIPGFNRGEIAMVSRTSPDAHASGCECRPKSTEEAFVIGYRKNPTNLKYVQDLIRVGMVKQYGAAVPPFRPVDGLGQIAAFSDVNGWLVWVNETGVQMYMYRFPSSRARMEDDFNLLYALAPALDEKMVKYGGGNEY